MHRFTRVVISWFQSRDILMGFSLLFSTAQGGGKDLDKHYCVLEGVIHIDIVENQPKLWSCQVQCIALLSHSTEPSDCSCNFPILFQDSITCRWRYALIVVRRSENYGINVRGKWSIQSAKNKRMWILNFAILRTKQRAQGHFKFKFYFTQRAMGYHLPGKRFSSVTTTKDVVSKWSYLQLHVNRWLDRAFEVRVTSRTYISILDTFKTVVEEFPSHIKIYSKFDFLGPKTALLKSSFFPGKLQAGSLLSFRYSLQSNLRVRRFWPSATHNCIICLHTL